MKNLIFAFFLVSLSLVTRADTLHLATFSLADNDLRVGEDAIVFINPTTTFVSSDEVRIYIKPSLKLNGVNNNDFVFAKVEENSWSFVKSLTTAGTYSLKIQLYLEDKNATDQIYNDIDILENRILELSEMIQSEQDPVVKEQLIEERDQRRVEKNQLNSILNTLRLSIGTEELQFVVTEN